MSINLLFLNDLTNEKAINEWINMQWFMNKINVLNILEFISTERNFFSIRVHL